MKFVEYLPVLMGIVKKDQVDNNKYKNIRKSGNNRVKILA